MVSIPFTFIPPFILAFKTSCALVSFLFSLCFCSMFSLYNNKDNMDMIGFICDMTKLLKVGWCIMENLRVTIMQIIG